MVFAKKQLDNAAQKIESSEPQLELVIVSLNNSVSINGHKYGGTVTVSPSLARTLRYYDGRAEHAKVREREARNRPDINLGTIK